MISLAVALSTLAHAPDMEGAVLIGGQAVNYWAARYRSKTDELADGPFTSKDIDFQGSRAHAESLADSFSVKAQIPSIDHATPMSGVVTLNKGTAQEIQIDFLPIPFGFQMRHADAILAQSVPVPIPGGRALRVMNPIHCLFSRAFNVAGLPGTYDTPHGLQQLHASIVCAREFIVEAAASDSRAALNLSEQVFQCALRDRLAKKLWKRKNVDIFDAVQPLDALGEAFTTKRYPQMRDELAKKR